MPIDYYEEIIQCLHETGFPLSAPCDQERHKLCPAKVADDCWCACHEHDLG